MWFGVRDMVRALGISLGFRLESGLSLCQGKVRAWSGVTVGLLGVTFHPRDG